MKTPFLGCWCLSSGISRHEASISFRPWTNYWWLHLPLLFCWLAWCYLLLLDAFSLLYVQAAVCVFWCLFPSASLSALAFCSPFVLFLWLGNDFLPHLPAFAIEEGGLQVLFDTYKRNLPFLHGYLTAEARIDLSRVQVCASLFFFSLSVFLLFFLLVLCFSSLYPVEAWLVLLPFSFSFSFSCLVANSRSRLAWKLYFCWANGRRGRISKKVTVDSSFPGFRGRRFFFFFFSTLFSRSLSHFFGDLEASM